MRCTLGWACALLVFAASLAMGEDAVLAARPMTETKDWFDAFYPYRLSIQLKQPAQGRIAIDLEPKALMEALRPHAIDVLNDDTFAYEKAILVDPTARKAISSASRLILMRDPWNLKSMPRLPREGTSESKFSARITSRLPAIRIKTVRR